MISDERSLNPAAGGVSTQASGRTPSFVHIGGQRCGTTWVYHCLEEHPEVFVSTPKELHYFDRNAERGDAWYLDHFTASPQHRAWGEATPSYLADERAPAELARLAPDAKLVCCLRHPVERAFSAYKLRRHGDMSGVSFAEALDQNIDNLIGRGMYAEHLRRWLGHFPREQILIQIYDDLSKNNAAAIRELFAFIGVDPEFRPSLIGVVRNAVMFPKTQDALRRVGLGWTIEAVRRTPLGTAIRKHGAKRIAQGRQRNYDGLDDTSRRRLLDIYAEPNRELESMIGRELTAWRV
jgi:hypothetical protein